MGVTAAIVLSIPGFFFGDIQREVIVIVGLCLLVWLTSVPCPAVVGRVAGVLASASLYIYLTHFQVYLPLRDDHPWTAFALSIVVGVVYWQAATFVLARLPWSGTGPGIRFANPLSTMAAGTTGGGPVNAKDGR